MAEATGEVAPSAETSNELVPASTGEPASSAPEGSASAKPVSAKPASAKPKSAPRSSVGAKKAGASKDNANVSHKIGDIVLGHLRGFPAWPARVVDPETVNERVKAQRPGKGPSGNSFCVQYFPVGDFSWLAPRDVSALSPSAIDAYLSETHRKKDGSLMEAYKIAKDPSEWAANFEESAAAQAAREAAANEGVDELEDEEAPTGGKRKRQSISKKAAPAKKTKSEKTKPDGAKSTYAQAKSSSKAAKPEAQSADDADPLAQNPENVKVKNWRHKLQRAFLGKDLPNADEMPSFDDLFKTIENYGEMTLDALSYSKIGKVMKKIAGLEGIPRETEYNLKQRASKLMNQWTEFIESKSGEQKPNGTAESKPDAKPESSKEPTAAEAQAEGAPKEEVEKMAVEA